MNFKLLMLKKEYLKIYEILSSFNYGETITGKIMTLLI